MTEDRLARRYHALLACYPRRYRAHRGAELVGTLLDGARPGQTRPTWREARALVLEGLRVRAGTAGHRAVGATLGEGVRVTVLLALAMWMLDGGDRLIDSVGPHVVEWSTAGGVVVAFGAVPFALVAWGRPGPAVPLVVAGAVAGVTLLRSIGADPATVADHRLAVLSVVALVGLLVLWRYPAGRPGAGTGMLACSLVPPLLLIGPVWLPLDRLFGPEDLFWYGRMLPLAVLYLGALAYAAVDPLPALALAAFLLLFVAGTLAMLLPVGFSPAGAAGGIIAAPLVAAAAAVAAAWLGVRRQVVALPTRAGE